MTIKNPRANKSLCVICDHLSIWHVEFENRICQLTQIPPQFVLAGGVTSCDQFKERALVDTRKWKYIGPRAVKRLPVTQPQSKAPKRGKRAKSRPIDPMNREWK